MKTASDEARELKRLSVNVEIDIYYVSLQMKSECRH